MAIYRANVTKVEPSADGTLHADVFVELQVSKDPLTWIMVSGGHFTIVITADQVLSIIADKALDTNVKKRVALADIIKKEALARGVDKADEAYAEWLKLIPLDAYPVEIIMKQ